ncbi:MAG: GNAT family N-acetyltransferase [Chitinivibrionia bacterium]|nr:GNAT family N-acetyltransferase [Chitinivibrionia bacterium]
MALKIKRYEKQDEAALFDLMRSEDDWTDYSGDKNGAEKYKIALDNCIVYVGYSGDVFCGFVRARDDYGFGVYIHDLLVHKKFRGNGFGKCLIEQVCKDYSGTVYVMSDVDEYYKKQGYTKIDGRIIVVRE